MTPVAIQTPAGPCFATHHAAAGPALLMLPQFGYEALSTYRIWRDLADELAGQGTAVLRLDLPGTGDSVGTADMTDPVGACRYAIQAAAAWLAERHGSVSILGCRFGALLAVDAVGRGVPCTALLLLDPPADGAALARQLRARARLEPGGSEDRRAYGVPLTDAMLEGLAPLPAAPGAAMDVLLLQQPPAAPPVLPPVLPPGTPPAWLRGLQDAGARIEAGPFDERDAFVMRDSFQRETPRAAFDRVLAFMAARSRPVVSSPPEPSGLVLPGMREEPIRFGPGLFGILCMPGRPRGIAGLIPSTGNLPRSGPGRASVLLARQLAAGGIASLRYDCAAVGDSEGVPHGDPAVETYLPDQVAHVSLALDALAERGHGRAVVVGHCSAAYLGWHAAGDDARIAGVFAINLQILKRMDPADAAITVRPHGTPRPSDPKPVLRPSPLAAAKQWVQRACPPALWDWLRSMTPEEIAVRRHLRRLLRRGCRVHFVYGDEEDEQYRFHRAFGRPGRLPRGAEVTLIHGADHMFSAARHRTRLLDLAAAFVASHDKGATADGDEA